MAGLGRGGAVLLVLVAVAATFLLAQPTWATGTIGTATGEVELAATGMSGAPVAWAGALVAGAAALLAAMSGRVGTMLAGAATFVAGAVVALGGYGAARDPGDLLVAEARVATGTNAPTVLDAAATPWPWGAVAGGAVLIVLGLLLVASAGRWSAAGRRFERPRGAAASPATGAASRSGGTGAGGVEHGPAADATATATATAATDPPPSVPGGASGRRSGSPDTVAGGTSASAAADAARDRYVDDWDALGRGEDPTASDR